MSDIFSHEVPLADSFKLNPDHLAPVVDDILHAAKNSARSPVLLVGEWHHIPYHVRMSAIMADMLENAGSKKPVIAIELFSNLPEAQTRDSPVAQTICAQLKKDDPARYREFAILVYRTLEFDVKSPLSRKNNLLHHLEKEQPVHFIDIPYTHSTKDVLWLTSPTGMKERNIHMAQAIEELARTYPGHPIIVQTGDSHIAGEISKYPPEESLHFLLKKAAKTETSSISSVITLSGKELFDSITAQTFQTLHEDGHLYLPLPDQASLGLIRVMDSACQDLEGLELMQIYNDMNGLGGKPTLTTEAEHQNYLQKSRQELEALFMSILDDYPHIVVEEAAETAPNPNP